MILASQTLCKTFKPTTMIRVANKTTYQKSTYRTLFNNFILEWFCVLFLSNGETVVLQNYAKSVGLMLILT